MNQREGSGEDDLLDDLIERDAEDDFGVLGALGGRHVVSRMTDWSCTCTAFGVSANRAQTLGLPRVDSSCPHIRRVASALAFQEEFQRAREDVKTLRQELGDPR
jgi:hypothetical protein